jgi:hypothetical protein
MSNPTKRISRTHVVTGIAILILVVTFSVCVNDFMKIDRCLDAVEGGTMISRYAKLSKVKAFRVCQRRSPPQRKLSPSISR